MDEAAKPQQILVPYDFSEASENAILYGIELAAMFHCEVSLVRVLTPKTTNPEVEAEKNKMASIANHLIAEHNLPVNVYVFKGFIHKVIEKIYPNINAIALIAGINARKQSHWYFTTSKITSDYRTLRIPIIVVHDVLPRKSIFKNIVVPLDFNKESKEKTAWPGYMSTLNRAEVTILTRNYKDTYFSAALRNNLALVSKLYANLKVTFQIKKEPDITCDIDKYAVEYGWLNNADLIVIIATKEVEIDDFLFGLKEKKIIDNAYKLPVMLINPRDDLFLPCGC